MINQIPTVQTNVPATTLGVTRSLRKMTASGSGEQGDSRRQDGGPAGAHLLDSGDVEEAGDAQSEQSDGSGAPRSNGR